LDQIVHVGPFLLRLDWLIVILCGIVGSFGMKFRLKRYTEMKRVCDSAFNSIFYSVLITLLSWKFSYALFHPMMTLTNPTAVLYLNEGDKGKYIAFTLGILYLLFRAKKDRFSLWAYLDLLFTGSLAFFTLYSLMVALLVETAQLYYSLQFLILLFLLICSLQRTRKLGDHRHINSIFLWLCLGQFFLSYFQDNSPYLWGFSKEQLTYISLSLLSLIFEFVMNRQPYLPHRKV
jgi:prolipoprotein diacylglyceryltransferase